MGKNLKRQNDGPVVGTPGGASRQGGKAPMSIGGKRHKQMSLVPFLRTPAHVEETPALQMKAGKSGISSTGLHKLGQLNLRTQQKQQPSASAATAAPTQGRPTITEPQWQDGSPASDDDFIISMSQTYERTQPEPCYDYGTGEHEEVELSLRRTQQYHAAGLTQHYSQHAQQHHQELLIATAAAALDNADTVVATSTAADAWEASVAQASALGAGTATLLLPPGLALEGQGSNQPSELVALAAAAMAGAREGSRSGPRPIIDLLPQLQPALPATSGGLAQTPELLGWGAGSGAGAAAGVALATASEDVADDGTTPPLQVGLPLFPIFTQGRVRRRPIHLIRHGESEYNLACKRRGGFGDPNDIFDAHLTPAGEKQAKGLRSQLLDLMHQHGDPLFIVSPLSRAIETFLLMLPDPERLRICPETPPSARTSSHHHHKPHHHHHHRPAVQAGQSQRQQQQQPAEAQQDHICDAAGLASKPVNMVICPFLSEFLLTSGDVGRPRSALIESYPQIAEQLRKGLDKERWWYENVSKGPNCAISKQLNSTEPDKSAKARVDRFRQFVLSQSHRPIVVVGHANFFRTLTHDSHYMSNCQMMSWAP